MQKRRIRGGAKRGLVGIGLLVVTSFFVTVSRATAAPSSDQALRERVEGLYGALQRGDWRQAEKYLTKDSKPIFRSEAKKPVVGYEVKSTTVEENGESAIVVVEIPLMSASSPRPLSIPEKTHWKLIGGNWYLQLSPPTAGVTPAAVGAVPPGAAQFRPLPLQSHDLKFESTRASIGDVHKGEIKVARFDFTNVSQRMVTIGIGQTSCDCLRMKSQQREFKPGEAGSVEFELDASGFNFDVVQALTLTVMLQTQPENAWTQLKILAALVPGSGTAESQPAEPVPPGKLQGP